MTLESGLNVQLSVKEEFKPEQELVLSLLQPMEVQIVLGKRLRVNLATRTKSVQVLNNHLHFLLIFCAIKI